jgi:predicted enzyme related to lactoylglutathione lyase
MASPARNPVVHLELHTRDLAQALGYYRELFEWRPETIQCAGGSYTALALGGRLDGGVVECATGRTLWLPYVEVTDVTRTTERARNLGAKVLLEPREGPAGWRAVLTAADGGEVALWQPKPGDPAPTDEFRTRPRS